MSDKMSKNIEWQENICPKELKRIMERMKIILIVILLLIGFSFGIWYQSMGKNPYIMPLISILISILVIIITSYAERHIPKMIKFSENGVNFLYKLFFKEKKEFIPFKNIISIEEHQDSSTMKRYGVYICVYCLDNRNKDFFTIYSPIAQTLQQKFAEYKQKGGKP